MLFVGVQAVGLLSLAATISVGRDVFMYPAKDETKDQAKDQAVCAGVF